MFQQDLAPLGSLTLSALVALLPLATIFVLLGWLRVKAHWAGLASVAVAIIVAVTAYRMPVGLALLAATEFVIVDHDPEPTTCSSRILPLWGA